MGSLIQSLTMASNSAHFFMSGTTKQFDFVLTKYQDALQAKADSKNSKSEVLLKLDKWYQNELPKKIKSRGKEAHLTHEEIVQLIKWKLARGKFYPQLTNLVRINTPRAVQTESRKAFRKLPNLEASITTLCVLKGVGTTLASAVLAAMAPDLAPFMADELLLSMPEVEGIDYTMKEYMKLVEKTKECVDRLNAQGGDWNPHKVEMAVWTYYILRELKPEVLEDLPEADSGNKRVTAVVAEENGVNGEAPVENGKNGVSHDDGAETVTPPASDATGKRPLDSDTTGNGNQEDKSEPECKRVCSDNGSEEMGKAAETQECVSEAPNGVNNTPQPITSGGD